jgi:hypothetical protein
MAQVDRPIPDVLRESMERMKRAQEVAKANSPKREPLERRLEDLGQRQPGSR